MEPRTVEQPRLRVRRRGKNWLVMVSIPALTNGWGGGWTPLYAFPTFEGALDLVRRFVR